MVEQDVIARIETGIPGSQVRASGDGSRMEVDVVADAFEGLSRVKRQQRVYACINELIQQGALHAVTIRALTPAERDASG